MSRTSLSGVTLALFPLIFGIQGQTNEPGKAASIKTSVDLVVRDKHGRLVQDLQPGDFQLLDDGKPVPIKALSAGASASARTKKENQRRRFLSLLLDDRNDATQALGLTALTELEKVPIPKICMSRSGRRMIRSGFSTASAITIRVCASV